jgi:DNA-binding transcriptional ArsR family regulator
MSIGHAPPISEVAAGPGLELLARLAAASRVAGDALPAELAVALAAVGDGEGESWLNLLGVPLDLGAPYDVQRLLGGLTALDPVELRRHLLGRYAWSWCTLAGIDDIEAAAAGDRDAAERLLAHPRYYGGHARASLATLLGVEPAETQRRIVAAAEAGARTLLPSPVAGELAEAARVAEETLAASSVAEVIERLAGGYRYVPELEAERVVLVPHLEPGLSLVLAQHRSARIVLYRVAAERGAEERLHAFGRALADPKRVEILALVGRGVGRSSDLVEATGLTRSTVHHHLAQLREAGLVALEGNARAYTYVPRREAAEEAASLVAGLIGMEEQ